MTSPNNAPKWERLQSLDSLTPKQMESMLAFLAGYDANAFDQAYEHVVRKELHIIDQWVPDEALETIRDKITINAEYGKKFLP